MDDPARQQDSDTPATRPRVSASHVPVIADVQALLAQGSYGAAVVRAYLAALADVERSHQLEPPPGYSHPDILRQVRAAESGRLPDLLWKLYEAYRPVRYGPPGYRPEAGDLLDILADIYGAWDLWNLYPPPGSASASPGQPRSSRLGLGGRRGAAGRGGGSE